MLMLPHIHALLAISVWRRLHRWGAWGLIAVGVADNSVIPLTGSTDVLTIWLAARHREPWPYYALMATIGAVLGGYITYSLAKKGGKQALEHRLPAKTAAKLCDRFQRWGFGSVAVPAILPPPFPMVPFLLAAGALQYPRRKFLAALSLGRGVRFTLIAALGARYGNHIVRFFSRHYEQALAILIGLAVLGTLFTATQYFRSRRRAKAAAALRHGGEKAA